MALTATVYTLDVSLSHVDRGVYERIALSADGRHVLCTFRGANTRRLHIVDTETGRAVALSPTAFGPAGNASYLPPGR